VSYSCKFTPLAGAKALPQPRPRAREQRALLPPLKAAVTPHALHSELARERSKALVCRNLFGESSALLSVGRFALVRMLGSGGMGVVYEACDPARSERVALKMLHGRGPSELYQLKREFRSLAELHHPNLATLHELAIADDAAYFTMELVQGRDFVSYARAGAAAGAPLRDTTRLRCALLQLCDGVQALHAAGKLHRDLKPSNVLVTEAGRVVLLDFGLVDDACTGQAMLAGTPEYMAPERGWGQSSAAGDWFSVGLMLQESLHGRRGPRREAEAAGGSACALERLALRLIADDAAQRPGFAEISEAAALAEGVRARSGTRRKDARPGPAPVAPFVGRRVELQQLTAAFARSRSQPVVVLVRGESGIGKSALLAEFARVTLEPAAALLLQGRCYERESLPFKALDSAIDALSRHLLTLPAAELAQLCPPADRAALLQLFPVLGRVPALRASTGGIGFAASGVQHPTALRALGCAALKGLFGRLARERPLVLCIDNLQWSDSDSGRLLGALLCDEDAPPMLVVASDRADAGHESPTAEALQCFAGQAPTSLRITELALLGLDRDDALALAEALLGDAAAARHAERLAAQAHGNPLLLVELSRWMRERAGSLGAPGVPALEALFEQRIGALSAASRLVLELVAVAGRALPLNVIAHAAGLAAPHTQLTELRAARLLHTLHHSEAVLCELEHDGIANAVFQQRSRAERVALHTRLVRAFEATDGDACEALVEQYSGALMPLAAARCAGRAADRAYAGLAFACAARLYERALQLGEWTGQERASLEHAHAMALEHAGCGLEAAEAYQRAAHATTNPLAVAQLEQRAAQHLMRHGRYEQGELLLRRGYEALKLPWHERRVALALSVAWHSLPRSWQAFARRTGTPASSELLRARAEFLSGAGRGIEHYDVLRAVHNALVCIAQSEALPDPVWHARAQAVRGLMRCASLVIGSAARGLGELEQACAVVDALADVPAQADLQGQLGLAHYLCGRPRAALEACDRCESHLRSLSSAPTDLHATMGLIGAALLELGQLREAERRWNAYAHRARLHGDLLTSTAVHAHPIQFALLFAAEDRESAQAILAQQGRTRAQHPRYMALAWGHAACSLECELYWGEPADVVRSLRSEQGALFKSGYAPLTEAARSLRARARLAAAAALPARDRMRAKLLRSAARDAAAWRQRGALQKGKALVVQAGVAWLRGRPQRALRHLDAALAWLVDAEAQLLIASVQYCKGALLADESGRALMRSAANTLRAEGVLRPERWVAWTACGFRTVLGGAP
jgi:hypothetical protein